MNLPTDGFEDIIGDTCIASFDHIKKLYAHEEEKALKSVVCIEKDIVESK